MNLKTNPAAGLIQDELEAREIAPATAARDMGIPRSRLSDIFAERKGISADTALRIERYLGVSASLLMRLQADFDLSKAAREIGATIEKTVGHAHKATRYKTKAEAIDTARSKPSRTWAVYEAPASKFRAKKGSKTGT